MLVGYIMLFLAVVALLPWGSDFPSVQIPSMSYIVLFVFKILKYQYFHFVREKPSSQVTEIRPRRLTTKIRPERKRPRRSHRAAAHSTTHGAWTRP